MTIATGTSLGPYEVLAPIGAGGMGEVYRARDTRLDRIVAVKVLPPGVASGAMRARFDREARAISGLSHPNICALYDVGHHDGVEYLVMEYLEGESLADRLSRGPLPPSQVIRYGAEIAQALHHAHRRGITHRDLKPGNVMLTAGGAKLLDFGLATLVEPSSGGSGQSETLTRREPLTAEGTIVGTLAYMSPEHVEGKEVDHRSDIFSLGVILYEMATGRRPFGGGSQAALIASILSSDPPMGTLSSPALERTIRTALEKNPDDRWQSAHDLGRELRWISDPSATAQQARRVRSRVPLLAVLVVVAALAGLAAGWVIVRSRAAPAAVPMRLTLMMPSAVRLARIGETNLMAISPDGRTVAFASSSADESALFLRRIDSPEVHKIEGTQGATGPFWSPDGAWLGYSAEGKLWKMRMPNGNRHPICSVKANGAVASWQGDTILFVDRPGGRPVVYRVPATGGEPVAVTSVNPSRNETRHAFPYLLDDGKHFLYLAMIEGALNRELRLATLDSPAGKPLLMNVSHVRRAGDRLLYVHDGKLVWQFFDVEKGLRGDPTVIAENVSYFYPTGGAGFDVSRSGTVVYTTNTTSDRMVLTDRNGKELRVVDERGSFTALTISPDGRKAAVPVRLRATGLTDIWIYDLARGVSDRFTSDPGMETYPVWTPDGHTLVYSMGTGSTPRLVKRQLSASTAQRIAAPGVFQTPGSVSADGKTLYYMSNEQNAKRDIFRTALDGTHAEKVVSTDFNESLPVLSPDGRWLAFISDATGGSEVYVLDLTTSERFRISNRGGAIARWSRSGELFYVTPGNVLVSVKQRVAGRWDDVVTADLFQAPADIGSFDVMPDGQSFLLSQWTPGASDAHIHVATGW